MPTLSHMGKVAVVGDVGGHVHMFDRQLHMLGVDADRGYIPPDLTVVQVGDLVHKGPDSDLCVDRAAQLLDAGPGRYVQLVGNHEAHYLGGPDVTGRTGVSPVPERTCAIVKSWWLSGRMQVAYATTDAQLGPVLITHGGLTSGFHARIGSPASAVETAERLNMLASDTDVVFRSGALMTGVRDFGAGVICPRTGAELAESWLTVGRMPFSQVHGHEGVWYWPSGKFHDDVGSRVRTVSRKDATRRWCWVAVGGKVLLSIDPVLGVVVPPGFTPVPCVLTSTKQDPS